MKTMMMKKQFRLMTACLAAATMIFASCGDDDGGNETPTDKKVTAVTVTPAAVSLPAGGTRQLSASVTPADATDKTVRWTSSPAGWVSEGGLVTVPTGTAAGTTATITATAGDGGGAKETCTVTVTAATPALTFTDDAAFDIPASTVGTAIENIDVAAGASGGTAPYTFGATGLPAGITISAAGTISGTPTSVAAAGTATVTVKDSSSPAQEKSVTIAYGAVTKEEEGQDHVTYTIGAAPQALAFGALQAPYTQPAARTVTVTNTGTGAVTLSQPSSPANYTVGTLSATELDAGATASFTVRPNAGLAVGAYNATITINGNNDVTATVAAEFTVTAATPALTFTDAMAFDIPASVIGTAIASIDVATGASGGTAPYTFSATGLPAGITISAAGTISGTPTTATEAAGTATVTVRDSSSPVQEKSVTIDCGKVSAAVAVPGAVGNFTATAGDGRVNLTWTAPANNGGSPITGYEVTRDNWATKEEPGATELNQSFAGLTNGTEYTFRIRALNAAGAGTESTVKATPVGTAATTPVITAHPQDASTAAGGTVTFGITATGATSYKWQRSGPGGSTWTDLSGGGAYSGTTTATMSFRAVPTAFNGYKFRCVATNAAGSTTSNAATLKVTAALTYSISASPATLAFGSLPVGYTQPAAQTVTITNTGTGSVTLSPLKNPVNYTFGTLSATELAAGAKATFTVRPRAGLAARNYDLGIPVSGSNGTGASVTATFEVTEPVPTKPTITSQPVDRTVAAGGTATFGMTATGATSYKWFVSTDGGTMWGNVADGGNYSGATTATLTISNAPAGYDGYRYRGMATNAEGSIYTDVVTLNVTVPIIPVTNITLASTSTSTETALRLNPTITPANATNQNIRWSVKNADADMDASIYSISGRGSMFTAANPGTAVITATIVDGIAAGRNYTQDFTITVTAPAPPVITAQPANTVIRVGETATFTIAATGASSYQWQVSNNSGTSWSDIADNSAYSGATTATLKVSGTAAGLRQLRCVATGAGGSTTSNTAALRVMPRI